MDMLYITYKTSFMTTMHTGAIQDISYCESYGHKMKTTLELKWTFDWCPRELVKLLVLMIHWYQFLYYLFSNDLTKNACKGTMAWKVMGKGLLKVNTTNMVQLN